jgi:hypothetical protein
VRAFSLARLLAILGLGLALGSIVVGHAVLVPGLRAATLVDPNMARALAGPLALRTAELSLGGCIILTMATPRAARPHMPAVLAKVASTLGLVATALAAIDRVLLLPRLQSAWAQVDIVAGRPQAQLELAEQLTRYHHGGLAVVALCLLGLAGMLTWRDGE